MDEQLERHCDNVVDAACDGEIVFFLGAGVNLCGRPKDVVWAPGGKYLPTGQELADYLAERFRLPVEGQADLARVAQYVSAERGARKLSKELHELFNVECAPTHIHRILARLPHVLEAGAARFPHQFIVTTNYDDALERAFDAAGEEYDLVSYMTTRASWAASSTCRPAGRSPDRRSARLRRAVAERPTILKIHGLVDRTTPSATAS